MFSYVSRDPTNVTCFSHSINICVLTARVVPCARRIFSPLFLGKIFFDCGLSTNLCIKYHSTLTHSLVGKQMIIRWREQMPISIFWKSKHVVRWSAITKSIAANADTTDSHPGRPLSRQALNEKNNRKYNHQLIIITHLMTIKMIWELKCPKKQRRQTTDDRRRRQ